MIATLESKLKVLEASHDRRSKETEEFLQILHSEMSTLRTKPTSLAQVHERMLADVLLESSQLKGKVVE
jgi:hypothetical protein